MINNGKERIVKFPQKLTLDEIYGIVKDGGGLSDRWFFRDGFILIRHASGVFNQLLLPETPYLLDDYRLGVVSKGSMRGIMNLQEVSVSAGTALFITPGAICQPIWASDDFELTGMGVPRELFQTAHAGRLPNLFNGLRMDGQCVLSSEEYELIESLFGMLWCIVKTDGVVEEVMYHAIAAITCYYDGVFASQEKAVTPQSTASGIFNRFIYLVNVHARSQRQLAFYADKMCMTERYLGTVVRQVSGITAKEWIDRAVIIRAKVMLKHGDLRISQISEELGFPNTSFFCKYFKRLTGSTPKAYRGE